MAVQQQQQQQQQQRAHMPQQQQQQQSQNQAQNQENKALNPDAAEFKPGQWGGSTCFQTFFVFLNAIMLLLTERQQSSDHVIHFRPNPRSD